MRSDIKDKILKEKNTSSSYVYYIKSDKHISKEKFNGMFLEYLYNKLLVSREEVNTDNIYELCQYSVDKVAKLPKAIIDSSEHASKCGGATTAMNKKALLLIAIRREFEIEFTGMEGANVESVQQLADLIYSKLQTRNY